MTRNFCLAVIAVSLLCFQAARCEEPEATRIVPCVCSLCAGDGHLPGFTYGGGKLDCQRCNGTGTEHVEVLAFMPKESEVFVSAEAKPGAEGVSADSQSHLFTPPPVLVLFDDEAIARARAALALSAVKPDTPNPDAPKESPYLSARKRAIEANCPLVILVNAVSPQSVPGAIVVSVDGLPDGTKGPCIVVGVPDGQGDMDRMTDLPGKTATLTQVDRAMHRLRQVKQACAGGCPAGCGCPATSPGATPADCNCPASARINKPVSVLPTQSYFASANYRT